MHVLSKLDPLGENFKILGITFDPRLTMTFEIDALIDPLAWKLQTILHGEPLQNPYTVILGIPHSWYLPRMHNAFSQS